MDPNNPEDSRKNLTQKQLLQKLDLLDHEIQEMKTLLKAGRDLSNTLDPDRLSTVLFDILKEKIQPTTLCLYHFQKESDSFTLIKSFGDVKAPEVFFCPEAKIKKKIDKGDPFCVLDSDNKLLFPQFFSHNDLEGLKSIWWAPLIMLDEVVGLITLGPHAKHKKYTPNEIRFFKQTALQAAPSFNAGMVFHQRTLEKEEQAKTLKNLSLLYNIGRAMNYVQDLKNLLRYILRQALAITKAEKGSIMLHNPETGAIHIRVMEGIADKKFLEKVNNQEIETQSFKPGEGVAGQVFATGHPIILNDIDQDERFVKAGKSFVKNIACVPMVVFNDVLGVINLTNKKFGDRFTEEDEELLKAVADQAAVAINKAQLWEMAVTDSLTGLFIRRFFIGKVIEELRRANRYEHSFTIIMADIDHFKNVNDSYGHQAGDKVLIQVAKHLQKKVRTVDVVARYGGEEFILLLPETSKKDGQMLAERLRAGIERIEFDDMPGVTVSMGVAGFPEDGSEIEGLIHKADSAMYKAKQTGRNKVVFYSEEIPLIPKESIPNENGD